MGWEAAIKQQQGSTEKTYHQQWQLSEDFSSYWCICHGPGTVGPWSLAHPWGRVSSHTQCAPRWLPGSSFLLALGYCRKTKPESAGTARIPTGTPLPHFLCLRQLVKQQEGSFLTDVPCWRTNPALRGSDRKLFKLHSGSIIGLSQQMIWSASEACSSVVCHTDQ